MEKKERNPKLQNWWFIYFCFFIFSFIFSSGSSGNRLIPVGGGKLHCEPPPEIEEGPENDGKTLLQPRIHFIFHHQATSLSDLDFQIHLLSVASAQTHECIRVYAC